MPQYTFDMRASVTIDADTEDEARATLVQTCTWTDEDVPYGEAMVYLPTPDAETAKLREIYHEDGTIEEV